MDDEVYHVCHESLNLYSMSHVIQSTTVLSREDCQHETFVLELRKSIGLKIRKFSMAFT